MAPKPKPLGTGEAPLELARRMKYHIPPVTFMGIEPGSVRNELGLSETLKRRLPEYARAAVRRCLG